MNSKKKKRLLFGLGSAAVICGVGILSVFAYKRISRELYKRKLLRECVVLEIPTLDIKAPVLEGTDNDVLSVAAGHFPDTGAVGSGNYCLAGHNSTIYACIFNRLDEAECGTRLYLYDNDENRTCYTYEVTEMKIVEPEDTGVLADYGDHRLTLITCTDDGTQRQVVIGQLLPATSEGAAP